MINPGDEVIVFEPFYENYGPDAILSGATPRFVKLRPPSWGFDPDELAAAFGPNTKAIIVNTPNNPSGHVFTRAELEAIRDLCLQWDTLAITDEIYEHIIYDDAEHISIASLDGMAERTVTINGLSKTYSVTGWRVGWTIAPPHLTDAIRKVHDFLTVGAAAPLQEAGAVGPAAARVVLRRAQGQVHGPPRPPLRRAAGRRASTCSSPQGAYYIMADIASYGFENDVAFARHLVETVGVAPVPGSSLLPRPAGRRRAHTLRLLQEGRDAGRSRAAVGVDEAEALMATDDLAFMTVRDLAPLIETRKVSPVDVVEAHLARIEALDGVLRSYIYVDADSARAQAKAAEAEIAAGGYRGPLHGVTVAHKDIIDVQGVATTAASKIMQGYVAKEDATVAARLRAAGAICLGKLNLIEFASGSMGLYGYARNPHNLAASPSGSSSGSGVAGAAGLATVVTGTDTGGSVRGPSAFNGLAGLRPTYGRVSRAGCVPLSWSQDTIGPMGRSVYDLAVMLSAMAGADERDTTAADVEVPDYTQTLELGLDGLRVGVPDGYFFDDLNPQYAAAIQAAIASLRELGRRGEAGEPAGVCLRVERELGHLLQRVVCLPRGVVPRARARLHAGLLPQGCRRGPDQRRRAHRLAAHSSAGDAGVHRGAA